MNDKINQLRERLFQSRPVILNITNTVTQDFIANGLLSLGASPIMSNALCEMEELVNIAVAVVINVGTLNDDFVTLATETCRIANILKKPIILDPVGAGATYFRTTVCKQLLSEMDIAIVRGNASEIMALAGVNAETKGVDSTMNTEDVISCAEQLSKAHNVVVAMSGAIDIIVDNGHIEQIRRGSPVMPQVTGTGCLLSAVVAAFHAVHANAFEAAWYASYFYAVSGEKAALKTNLPGSFKMHFIDALHQPLM